MIRRKDLYFSYWKDLKAHIDENGLDWVFSSFEADSEAVVRIGAPKCKVTLSLAGGTMRSPVSRVAAGFWIPDSREDFDILKASRARIEAAMGKALEWDMRPGRKSAWVRVAASLDIARPADRAGSLVWFAEKATQLRDICYGCLAEAGRG